MITMPPYAFYWKYTYMKKMEKAILDDLRRIESKGCNIASNIGKTLADIPRK